MSGRGFGMSGALSLIRLRPDMAGLARWGLERNFLPKGNAADFGYVLHAALKEALGEFAPRPFVLRRSGSRPVASGYGDEELLGYVGSEPENILAAAALPSINGSPEKLLKLTSLEARALPTEWPSGARLGFEVRARPVARSRGGKGRGTSHEVDIAAWRARQSEIRSEPVRTKEQAYRDWLAERFDARGARLLDARLVSMRRSLVRRRPVIGAGKQARDTEGPDVVFRGTLLITDPEGFSKGLAKGVGRHTAFGFGCLLLSPPGARS